MKRVRILALLLAIVLCVGMFPAAAFSEDGPTNETEIGSIMDSFDADTSVSYLDSSATDQEITDFISNMGNQINNRYWNGGKNSTEMVNAAKSGDYTYGTTTSACTVHSDGSDNTCTSNCVDGAWQCNGFARWMAYAMFGTDFHGDGWTYKSDVNGIDISLSDLNPGDIIFYNGTYNNNKYNHWVTVWYIDGNDLYVADANAGGKCRIHFGKAYDTSDMILSLAKGWYHHERNNGPSITVTFQKNNGEGVDYGTYYVGHAFGTLPVPTKSGYVFDGWYTSQDWNTKITESTTVSFTSNVMLFAKWTEGTSDGLSINFDTSYTTKNETGTTTATRGVSAVATSGNIRDVQNCGFCLYDSNGNLLKEKTDESIAEYGSNYIHMWYIIGSGKEVDYALSPGTTYKYRFYVNTSSQRHYSDYLTFTTNSESGSAGTYNASAALTYAANNYSKQNSLCAQFVCECLQAGGLNIPSYTGCDKLVQWLEDNGYERYQLSGQTGSDSTGWNSFYASNNTNAVAGDPIFFCSAGYAMTEMAPGHAALLSDQLSSNRLTMYEHNPYLANTPVSCFVGWDYSNNCYAYNLDVFGFHVSAEPAKYTLDVNAYVNDIYGDTQGAGTFDIYINGNLVADDAIDYWNESLSEGTVYSITDIRSSSGYVYNGCVSGSLSGTLNSNTIVDLSFSTEKGSLNVMGLLNDSLDTEHLWGKVDVYINDQLVADDCTGFSNAYPVGSSYRVEFVSADEGCTYNGVYSGSLTGTIAAGANTVILSFSNDDEWTYADKLPAEITGTHYEIQYRNKYTCTAKESPGSEWTNTGTVSGEYVNSGDPYGSDIELETSDTRVLTSYFYYHYCGRSVGNDADHVYNPNSFNHYDSITDVDKVIEYSRNDDYEDSRYKYYELKWKDGSWAYCSSGVTCDGSNGTHGAHSCYWYKYCTYQDREYVATYSFEKTGDWTDEPDASASSYTVRYRRKYVPVTSVSISTPSQHVYMADGSCALTYSYEPADADTPSFVWKSSDENVAVITETVNSGKITYKVMFKTPGVTVITCETEDGSVISNSITLCVHGNSSIVMPDNMTDMYREAFADDSSIEEVVFPEGMKNIDSKAFKNCTNLRFVYLPSTIEYIAYDAFLGCSDLTFIGKAGCTVGENCAAYNGAKWITE